jgi:tRNA(Ile)-lysidine synthase
MPRPTPSTVPHLQLDEHLFRPGQRIAIAVSGGADSVALLRALLDRQDQLGLVLSIVHLHHGIRGEEADRDQAFVQALATRHNLLLHLCRVDTPAHAAQHGETLEEAARNLRYTFFHELLDQHQVDAIATAHTLDDQAETVLQKVLRGAWTEGLGGISPVITRDTGSIVRPLLNMTRVDIEAYLRALDQTWCEDATNQNRAHTRNRIRHELLPVLRDYNPQLSVLLSRLSTIARDEEAFWQREIARIGPGLILPGKPVRGGGRSSSTHPEAASIAVELDRLRPLGPALQRRLLRWLAAQLHCELDFQRTEGLLQLCGFTRAPGSPAKRLQLSEQIYAQRTAREIQIIREPVASQPPAALEYTLPIPGKLRVPELGLHFITRLQPGLPPQPPEALIRTARPGDRVTQRFTSGPKKIKDILERLHLSAAQRQQFPLVVWPATGANSQIIWLRDVEIDPSTLSGLPFVLEVVPF